MPKFSIIMPAYNSARHIGRAIDSVLNQSIEDWELLIVDDRSSDATKTIANYYADEEPRIIALDNCHAKGASGARNTAIRAANGQYISFLDSDDIWGPDMLSNQLRLFKNGAVLTHDNIQVVDISGRSICNYTFPGIVSKKMMLFSNFMPNLTVSYSVSYFGKVYAPDLASRNDYALWLSLLSLKKAVSHNCNYGKSSYTRSSKGLSSQGFIVNTLRYVSAASLFFPKRSVFLATPIYLSIQAIKACTPTLFNLICKMVQRPLG